MKLRVAIIGGYPPPIGGNSVHIQRCFKLFHERGVQCDVLDLYSNCQNLICELGTVYRLGGSRFLTLIKCSKLIMRQDYSVIHIHVSAFKNFIYFALIFKFISRGVNKKVLTIHSGSFVSDYSQRSSIYRWLVKFSCSIFHEIITVSDEQRKLVRDITNLGVNTHVMPAYIPVKSVRADSDMENVIALLKGQSNFIICTSGYGLELYGYHHVIEAVKTYDLSKRVSLLICIYNDTNDGYMQKLVDIGQGLNLIIERDRTPDQFSYYLSNSNLYIRATDRDGDSVAIREANSFGVPVIASDAVQRPSYCNIYKYGDTEDLANKIAENINGELSLPNNCNSELSDPIDKLLKIYKYNS